MNLAADFLVTNPNCADSSDARSPQVSSEPLMYFDSSFVIKFNTPFFQFSLSPQTDFSSKQVKVLPEKIKSSK